jgi:hypothetical protein
MTGQNTNIIANHTHLQGNHDSPGDYSGRGRVGAMGGSEADGPTADDDEALGEGKKKKSLSALFIRLGLDKPTLRAMFK